MKKMTITLVGIVCIASMTLTGCRRHYEVRYARVPVDTLAQRDSSFAAGEEELFGSDDEVVIETPETNFEFKPNHSKRKENKKELEEYLRENGEY